MRRKKILRWTRIRGLGELQVLTRASYFLLFIVPMLAALWPVIQVGISQYNFAIGSSVNALKYTASVLEFQSRKLEEQSSSAELAEGSIADDLKHVLGEVRSETESLRELLVQSYVEDSSLPQSWAFLFFASLSIFLAHLLYQSFAPPLVREVGIDDYVAKRKSEYSKNPTPRVLQEALSALRHSKTVSNEDPALSDTAKIIPSPERWELDTIEAGSRHYYNSKAEANPTAITVAASLYFVGIVLILVVIVEQSFYVGEAAGWWK